MDNVTAAARTGTIGHQAAPVRMVDFDRPVPAGEVPFPVMWDGALYQLTGTPAAIGRAAAVLLEGLPSSAEMGISRELADMLAKDDCISIIGMGTGCGQDFLTGNAGVISAFAKAL